MKYLIFLLHHSISPQNLFVCHSLTPECKSERFIKVHKKIKVHRGKMLRQEASIVSLFGCLCEKFGANYFHLNGHLLICLEQLFKEKLKTLKSLFY